MKRLVVFFVLFASLALTAEEKLPLAVVEFEEKNNIGFENAGRIIAEWVVTEIKRIGLFEVGERLLLDKVLEEQSLALSDLMDETKAIKVGKMVSARAIVTGSVMNIAGKISITARIIDVEKGTIIKTARVSTTSLEELEKEAVVLANELCDISREQFAAKVEAERMSLTSLVVGGGFSMAGNEVGTSLGLNADMLFNHKIGTLWVHGAPVAGVKHFEVGAFLNLVSFIGIGGSYGMIFDDEIDYFQLSYALFGVNFRPINNLSMALQIGFSFNGVCWTDSSGPVEGLGPYFSFLSNYSVTATYYISENLGIQAKYVGFSIADFKSILPSGYYYPYEDEYVAGKFALCLLYRFVIF